MNGRYSSLYFSGSRWISGLVLVVALYLIYSSTFLNDYLMNDELGSIGTNASNLESSIRGYFFGYGRGLFPIYHALIYGFVGYNPIRIQIVRFINFASIATIAVVFLSYTESRLKSRAFAFWVTLFFFSLLSFQGLMGYSLYLISNSQPSMWLSLLAFYLHFYAFYKKRFSGLFRGGVVLLLFVLAMQSTQTFAFFSMIPLTYLILTDWENRNRNVASFLLLAIVAFAISTLVYKISLDYWHAQGREGYLLGEQAFGMAANDPIQLLLRTLNPFAYWSAFKIWSYPFPFHYTLPLGIEERYIASFILAVWIAIVLWAIRAELRQRLPGNRKPILFKWLSVLVCLGFGGVFMVADSPERIVDHRPHLVLTFIGVAVAAGAYALQILASQYPLLRIQFAKSIGIIVIVMTGFGAQAGVLRGIVIPRMEQIDFMRTELMARNPSDYENVFVVLPDWAGCVTEPCSSWFGRVVSFEYHITRIGGYRYAMATVGIPPWSKEITFENLRPESLPADAIIIDWNKFVAARRRHLAYLRRST